MCNPIIVIIIVTNFWGSLSSAVDGPQCRQTKQQYQTRVESPEQEHLANTWKAAYLTHNSEEEVQSCSLKNLSEAPGPPGSLIFSQFASASLPDRRGSLNKAFKLQRDNKTDGLICLLLEMYTLIQLKCHLWIIKHPLCCWPSDAQELTVRSCWGHYEAPVLLIVWK